MNQALNKRTFLKTAISGLVGLLGVNSVAAPKKKFGYASVHKPIYRNGKMIRHGDVLIEFEDKEFNKAQDGSRYWITECNDEEGWFIATGEHGTKEQGFIRYATPRKFENVEFTIRVVEPELMGKKSYLI